MKRRPVVFGAARSGIYSVFSGITSLFLITIVCLSACTSIQPVADNAEALQQQIRAGQVLRQGDHVRVVTQDGESRKLTVLVVEGDVLKGRLYAEDTVRAPMSERQTEPPKKHEGSVVEISVRDIVFVEEEHVSVGKTAGGIGTGVIVFLSALLLLSL